MSYLDGINFGYDQISAAPNIPLMFSATEMHGKNMLTARDEWIRPIPLKHDKYPVTSEKKLQKKAKDPTIVKETFVSKKEPMLNLQDNHFDVIVLLLIIFLVAMHIKMYISVKLLKTKLGMLLTPGSKVSLLK